jgi:cysteine synthase A
MAAIGNTPLIKLIRITCPDYADVFVKYEGGNPTGSMKDRMALSMIEGAEQRGELQPGGTIVEYTGGSTGSSLAMVCATKGYKAHLVSSDAFAKEKLQTMKAFGADLEIIKSDRGKLSAKLLDDMIAMARVLSKETNTYWTDQVNNIDNKRAYHHMAYEIMADLGTDIDEFVMAVGGGGCFSGNAEVFKEKIQKIRCIAVEPYHVRNISGGKITGTHQLEGIGLGFIPSIFRKDLVDDIVSVKDEDAFDTARHLARNEGIFGGITSGANVWAALKRAKMLGKGKKVVTVIVDSGLRYLDGNLYR